MKYLFLVFLLISCSSKKVHYEQEPVKDLIYNELSDVDKIKINNCVLNIVENDWEAYIDIGDEEIRPGAYTKPDNKLSKKALDARMKCLEQLKKVKEFERQFSY